MAASKPTSVLSIYKRFKKPSLTYRPYLEFRAVSLLTKKLIILSLFAIKNKKVFGD